MGEEKLTGSLSKGRTAGAVLAGLLTSWAEAWNKPLDKCLPREVRRRCALAGSAPWVLFNFSPTWLNYVQSFEDSTTSLVIAVGGVLAGAVIAWWFAWLIGYQDRPCSPSRFFLEGLLFPGFSMALLSGRVPF